MFADLCSIGSNQRLQYTATFCDYKTYNDKIYVLLKGIMLDGIKMLDKLSFESSLIKGNVKFEKGDLVTFTANVKQERKPLKFLPVTKAVYTSYFYTLTDIKNIQCANRIEPVFDLPECLKEIDAKLYIVYNSFSKKYLIKLNEKEYTFPITMPFEEICHQLG